MTALPPTERAAIREKVKKTFPDEHYRIREIMVYGKGGKIGKDFLGDIKSFVYEYSNLIKIARNQGTGNLPSVDKVTVPRTYLPVDGLQDNQYDVFRVSFVEKVK